MLSMDSWRERAISRMTDLGVTQADLMPVFGVTTRGAVGHYLNGRREPPVSALIALAARLGMGLEELLVGGQRTVSPPSQTGRPNPVTLRHAMRLLSFVSQLQAAPVDFSEDADALLMAYDLVSLKPSDYALEDASVRMSQWLRARGQNGDVDRGVAVGLGRKGVGKDR